MSSNFLSLITEAFMLSRCNLPTASYNPTPWNPHECWIESLDRSRDKQRTEKETGREMAKFRLEDEATLKRKFLEGPPAVACRAGIKKPESLLRLG